MTTLTSVSPGLGAVGIYPCKGLTAWTTGRFFLPHPCIIHQRAADTDVRTAGQLFNRFELPLAKPYPFHILFAVASFGAARAS